MDIYANVAYLAGLSIAAERLVEIIRGFKLPLIDFTLPKNPNLPKNEKDVEAENRRISKLNILAIITGTITAAIAYSIHVLPARNWFEVVMYGVLAGAGSGFWNAVLSYLLQLKTSLQAPPAQMFGGDHLTMDHVMPDRAMTASVR